MKTLTILVASIIVLGGSFSFAENNSNSADINNSALDQTLKDAKVKTPSKSTSDVQTLQLTHDEAAKIDATKEANASEKALEKLLDEPINTPVTE